MNYSASIVTIPTLEYSIRQINEQITQLNNENIEEFIKSLREAVVQLTHVQQLLTTSTTITPFIQSIGSAISHSVAIIEHFNDLYDQVNKNLEVITSLQEKLMLLEEELKVFRVYVEWCSKMYLVVSNKFNESRTWIHLAESLSIEEDYFDDDVWVKGGVHIELKRCLTSLEVTPEMWNKIILFSSYRNTIFHAGNQGMSRNKKEKKAIEDWEYIDTLESEKYDVSTLYKVLEVVCDCYKWKYCRN